MAKRWQMGRKRWPLPDRFRPPMFRLLWGTRRIKTGMSKHNREVHHGVENKVHPLAFSVQCTEVR